MTRSERVCSALEDGALRWQLTTGVNLPIAQVVLDDAETIDPDIFYIEFSTHLHRVSECFGQCLQSYVVLM
jgi:hypothetical protein